jgi:hypothetical protein
MRGFLQPPAGPQIGVSELPVELGIQYLAGGGASHLPVTLRAQIRPKGLSFPEDFEGFAFANGLIKEGILRRGLSLGDGGDEDADDAASARPTTATAATGCSPVRISRTASHAKSAASAPVETASNPSRPETRWMTAIPTSPSHWWGIQCLPAKVKVNGSASKNPSVRIFSPTTVCQNVPGSRKKLDRPPANRSSQKPRNSKSGSQGREGVGVFI